MEIDTQKVYARVEEPPCASSQLTFAPAKMKMARRQFLQWLGLVGVATVVAGCGASQRTATTFGVQSSGTASEKEATTPCSARCPNGCAYPGRCHDYVDTNNNQLCDNGECA
jgi:hypothetical protein